MSIREYPMPGTLLCGRAALDQLGHELSLRSWRRIAILVDQKNRRRIRRELSRIHRQPETVLQFAEEHDPQLFSGIDALIIAGPKRLLSAAIESYTPRIWIPLAADDLLHPAEAAISVLDRRLLENTKGLELFYRSLYAGVLGEESTYPFRPPEPVHFQFSADCSLLQEHPPGEGRILDELTARLREEGIQRPLLLSDPGLEAAGLTEKVGAILKAEVELELRSDVPPDSDTALVDEIAGFCRQTGRDGLIALGGGSVLDTAKGVAMLLSYGTSHLTDLEGAGHLPPLSFPWYALPTTTGTGSECTKAAVVSDAAAGRKLLFISPALQARAAFLDTGLTETLPPHISAQTGMDAMCHAVEAFTCLGKNPLSDLFAWKAIELLSVHLKQAVLHPEVKEHRAATALASSLAGAAFSNSMVGMVHTIGHSLGAVSHAPHGACMAVLLPRCLEFNLELIQRPLGELLIPLKNRRSYDETLEILRGTAVISILRGINHALNSATGGRHPERLREIVDREGNPLIRRQDFQQVAAIALGDASLVYNPREIRTADIIEVLEDSY